MSVPFVLRELKEGLKEFLLLICFHQCIDCVSNVPFNEQAMLDSGTSVSPTELRIFSVVLKVMLRQILNFLD